MKLTELEPTLDPRRPLHFGAPPGGSRALSIAARRSTPSDQRPVPSGRHLPPAVTARPAEDVAGLPSRTGVRVGRAGADLERRAAAAVQLFTGAATGLLVALWRERADRMEAQLRDRLTSRTNPVTDRSDATPGSTGTEAAATAQDAWGALATFDALHRAFAAGDVRALSPAAAASFARAAPTAARVAAAVERRAVLGAGVVWTPDGLVAWHGTADGIRLFAVPGADLAAWVTATIVTAPVWPTAFVGTGTRFADVPAQWRAALVLIDRLTALGTVPTTTATSTTIPVTRLLMTATEARHGLDPIDLTTGGPPTQGWQRAHHREVFSAMQGRRIRVFVDAAWAGERPPMVPTLVTVLPS
jgi:hypothetical protein